VRASSSDRALERYGEVNRITCPFVIETGAVGSGRVPRALVVWPAVVYHVCNVRKGLRIMADPVEWPPYDIGPHDSIFAIAVASVNYGRLEFAFEHVFAKVLGITSSEARAHLATIRNYERARKEMRDALPNLNWPQDTKDRVIHFIKAFEILAYNRNCLDHSNVFVGDEAPTGLYKSDRKGNTILTNVTLAELRQVADDMRQYCVYGSNFSNSIGPAGELFTPLLPDQPPLPKKLNYTSEPLSSKAC
jgi:hypothetical protein